MVMLLNPLLHNHFELAVQQLTTCRQQAEQQPELDDEALHAVRIQLRQLRSLIRPLTAKPILHELDQQLATLMKNTNVLRDDEVLIAELARKQLFVLSQDYQQRWQQHYQLLQLAHALEDIIQKLASLASPLEPLYSEAALARRIRTYCRSQRRALLKLLKDKKADRHKVRLAVKRLRYSLEMYGTFLRVPAKTHKRLKTAQDALGNWHDRWVWLEKSLQDERLQVVADEWRQEMAAYHKTATRRLKQLRKSLRKLSW